MEGVYQRSCRFDFDRLRTPRKDFYMMPDLQDLRKEIDDIDEQMTALFEKRMAIESC